MCFATALNSTDYFAATIGTRLPLLTLLQLLKG
jgi:hypothetical protein